jgi:isoaspartyl peptidase/L-asparaginase-like protein (Ntn-hydrolase superfamily)
MEHGLPMISPQMALSLVTPETKARFERHSAILNDTVTPETKPRLEGHSAILNDTVGVLVLGDNGRMVAASSSSGISLKMAGRVGSAAMVGSGVYIDKSNESAISVTCSGAGETIMKHFLALNICKDEMYLVNNNLENVGAIGIIDRPDSCSIFYTHSSDCFQIAYKFNHEPLVSGVSKTSNSKVVFHQKKFAK